MSAETLLPFNWEEAKKDPSRLRWMNGHLLGTSSRQKAINFGDKWCLIHLIRLASVDPPKQPLAEAYAEWLDGYMLNIINNAYILKTPDKKTIEDFKIALQYFKDNVYNKPNT